jgi:hypothetical protein
MLVNGMVGPAALVAAGQDLHYPQAPTLNLQGRLQACAEGFADKPHGYVVAMLSSRGRAMAGVSQQVAELERSRALDRALDELRRRREDARMRLSRQPGTLILGRPVQGSAGNGATGGPALGH